MWELRGVPVLTEAFWLALVLLMFVATVVFTSYALALALALEDTYGRE